MSSPNLFPESNILISLNVDKVLNSLFCFWLLLTPCQAVNYVVHWLQNSSITQYFENHPDACDAIVAAVQRLPQHETLSTTALTPCYTELTNEQAPASPLQHITQQEEPSSDDQPYLFAECYNQSVQTIQQEVIQGNRPSYKAYIKDVDDLEVEHTFSDSQGSADFEYWSPFDANDTQDASKRDELSGPVITSSLSHQANGTCLVPNGNQDISGRRVERIQTESWDETEIERDSNNSQSLASPEESTTLVATLPKEGYSKSKLPKSIDALYNEECDRFTKLFAELRAKIQRIAGTEARA
jgi:hypothetical protein